MHTARLLTIFHSIPSISGDGGSAQPPWMQTPLEADPGRPSQSPLDADPLDADADPPPRGRPPWMQIPLVM